MNYKDLIQCEIIEDGVQVTKTSRGSQVGGALIGGALAGGVGAVIGGLSGSSTTSDKVRKLQIKITVNNTVEPILYVVFLDDPSQWLQKSEAAYIEYSLKDARSWHGLISVLIKRADEESVQIVQTVNQSMGSNLVADELSKLAQLHKDGVLDKVEFDAQKAKLLA